MPHLVPGDQEKCFLVVLFERWVTFVVFSKFILIFVERADVETSAAKHDDIEAEVPATPNEPSSDSGFLCFKRRKRGLCLCCSKSEK